MQDEIIAEIRRVAAAMGGKAPGRRTFERETGITESTWRGVYWARWGDALVAAGLSANEKQGKLDDDFVLRKLAEAFRQFSRTPTLIELRMYRQQDAEFPAHNTLAKHFPAKEDMVQALREWLHDRPDFDDVAAMLPVAASTPAPARSTAKIAEGHVYLIKSGDFYKIGRSDELERRVREIRIALPDVATLVHSIRTDDPPGIETYWHRRFATQRANGEWFKLTTADVAAFRRRKYQ